MTIDFGELLSRTWKITWNHKTLWSAGFVMMAAVFLMFPLMFIPMFMLFGAGDPLYWIENPMVWILWGVGFLLFIGFSYGVGSLVRPMLVIGALKAEGGAERLSFGELFRNARPFFWRFLGLMLLYAVSLLLVDSIIGAIYILGNILTFGLATLCMMPLSFLMYPLLYAAIALLELTETVIVVEGLGVMDALRRGWEILRNNKMNIFILALIVYLGLGMVSAIVIMPFMLPFMFMPMLMIEEEISSALLWGIGIWTVIFFPVMALVQGVVFAFTKTSWVLFYLRIARKPEPPVVVDTAQSA